MVIEAVFENGDQEKVFEKLVTTGQAGAVLPATPH